MTDSSNQQTQTNGEPQKAPERILQDGQENATVQQAGVPTPPSQTPSPIPAVAQRAVSASEGIKLNFDNFPLYDFITYVADSLGITPLLVDPDVKGTVNFHSSMPIPNQDVLPIFNLVLKSNNAALVKAGTMYKVVPVSQGLKEGLEVVTSLPPVPPAKPPQEKDATKKQDPDSGAQSKPPAPPASPFPTGAGVAQATQAGTASGTPQTTTQQQTAPPAQARPAAPAYPHMVTDVIPVEFVPVQTLIEPLRLFMTEGGVIMPYERQNMLIITDYNDNLQKLLEVIHLLDNNYLDTDLIELVEIKYNASADVLEDLKKIFGSGAKDSATGVSMVSLDRMNAILLMANSKRALEEAKRWIARLDTVAGRSVQTFIYTVENGTATNIAQVLALLFGGGEATSAPGVTPTGAQGGTSTRGTLGVGGTTGTPSTGLPSGSRTFTPTSAAGAGVQGMGTQYPYGQGTIAGQPSTIGGPRLSQGAGMSSQVLNGGQFVGLQGPVRIVANDINNSLIIQGSAADFDYLLETIKRMDVMPRQAIIDARIFEIDLTNDLSFGVSATLQAKTSGQQQLTTGSIDASTGALSAASFAFIGSSREILMSLNALRQKTKVRILEAPSVLAIDGQMARIQVGGQVPIPGGTFVSAAGGATTSVSYADTGTELEITPRISASGVVTLDVAQSVTAVGSASSLGPTFTTTNVQTTLAVKDGESVAIAGLIRESDSSGRNGVPFLSEIPVLGSLFGATTRNTMRTEMLVMITPHVIKTPERFREMTDQLRDSLRNVGKYADQKEQEMKDSQEKELKERIEREQEQIKKSTQQSVPPAPVKKQDEPTAGPVPQTVKKDAFN
jgi:general secretion pathway protein D